MCKHNLVPSSEQFAKTTCVWNHVNNHKWSSYLWMYTDSRIALRIHIKHVATKDVQHAWNSILRRVSSALFLQKVYVSINLSRWNELGRRCSPIRRKTSQFDCDDVILKVFFHFFAISRLIREIQYTIQKFADQMAMFILRS